MTSDRDDEPSGRDAESGYCEQAVEGDITAEQDGAFLDVCG